MIEAGDDTLRFARTCPECHTLMEEFVDTAYCPLGHSYILRSGSRVWEVFDLREHRRAGLLIYNRDASYVRWEPGYREVLGAVLARPDGPEYRMPARPVRHHRRAA